MRFHKTTLTRAEEGYSVAGMRLLGQYVILGASEGRGPGYVFVPPALEPAVLAAEPGGCMGFAPVPGRDDAVLMITRFYPIFKSEEAAVHLFTAVDGFAQPWRGRQVLPLPFVHRICTVTCGDQGVLLAASVCGGKDFQDDWSRPGAVYAVPIPDDLDAPWKSTVILPDIHTNHGMSFGSYGGNECVFISGTEGIFALAIPSSADGEWRITRVLETPVSEVAVFDLDGDGEHEIAVIEPFHGETMAVYKSDRGSWTKVFTAPLGFGHGLWAGNLAGNRCVVVGNRAGTKNLCCYRDTGGGLSRMEEIVVDHESGTTNIDVVEMNGEAWLVASNPHHEEYALYRVTNGGTG